MPDEESSKEKCGVVMPISAFDKYPASHWSDVLQILTSAIEAAGFNASMVSDADDVGVIHKRIVQNLYSNVIVVCDVSGKNPNVMFELGMRLAFDKPTVIVKDDATSYNFDTSPIEHLTYPFDLRFQKIVTFREGLAAKIRSTHEAAIANPDFSTFLKHFGDFQVAKIDQKEVPLQQIILQELEELKLGQRRLRRELLPPPAPLPNRPRRTAISLNSGSLEIVVRGGSPKLLKDISRIALSFPGVTEAKVEEAGDGRALVSIKASAQTDLTDLAELLRGFIPPGEPPSFQTAVTG